MQLQKISDFAVSPPFSQLLSFATNEPQLCCIWQGVTLAGHVGTARISGDPDFHRMYHDGQSHYYIDGTVNESGRIPILVYDEEEETYSELKE